MFTYRKDLFQMALLSGFLVLSAFKIHGQIAGGGQFALEQSAIASGGANSSGGQFAIAGTSGQSIAGQPAAIAPFAQHAGFWNTAQFAPTSAEVTVSGRVRTDKGSGVRSVQITMTNANGEMRTTVSGAGGHFQFSQVPAGETYIFNASARRYTFGEPTQVRTITEDTDDIIFVAVSIGLTNN